MGLVVGPQDGVNPGLVALALALHPFQHVGVEAQRHGLFPRRHLHLDLAQEYGQRLIGLRAGELVFDGNIADVDDDTFRNIYGRSITAGDVLADTDT